MATNGSQDGPATFEALGLDPSLVETLTRLGYEEPTPIQREAIPPLLEGRNLIGQAATGTGKSAAFALPLLQRLERGRAGAPGPSALILVPTRELAVQLAEAVYRYGRALDVRVLPVYGGQSFRQQLRVLKRGVDVVVATPGRALDHIDRGTLALDGVQTVVLDEADEMLDMGFTEDLEAILDAAPTERQTVLFAATMPPRIVPIAKRHVVDPVRIQIARERLPEGAVPQVRQTAYIVARGQKLAVLGRVLDMENPEAAIVFCRTRNEVDELAETVNAHGYRAEALHGGMSQEERDRIMKKLRGGSTDLVIATDVAARGLDIPRLSHVVNYDVPNAPESYIHRIGRVGRAGRRGVAITLAHPREHRLLRNFEQLTRRKIEIAEVPTVADLRTRRLELVRATLRETLLGDDLDEFRVVVEALADEFDPMEVALAAVKMAHDASGVEGDGTKEIAEPPRRVGSKREGRPRGRKGERVRGKPGVRAGGRRQERSERRTRERSGNPTRLFIGAGREAGIRPQDLVGAITGETGLSGREIGAIEIANRFSIVEVEEEAAGEVIAALRGSTIKGRKATVRRDRRSD